MAYISVPAPQKPKSKNTFLIVVLCIFLIGTLFGCIAFATGSVEAKDMAASDGANIKVGEAYYVDKLYVMSAYGEEYNSSSSSSSKTTTEMCYIVYFGDKNGESYYASLGVEPSSDIYDLCNDFQNDETKYAGDLVLSGCFKVNSFATEMDEKETLYREFYLKYALEMPGTDTKIHLTYEAATIDGYVEKATNEKTIGASVSGVMAALAGVGLYFAFRQRKKMKAEELAAAQQAAAQRAAYEQEIAQQAAQMNNDQVTQ